MVLQIYLDPCTVNSRKVLAGLALLGTPCDFHFIDYFAGGQKDPEYVKINHSATVPCATDGDLVLTESNAILQYAADLDGIGSSPYYPKDLKKRADINRWLLWETSVWFPSTYIYLVEHIVKPLLKTEPDPANTAAEEPNYLKLAMILDNVLAKNKYLTGDELTIADIAVAAPMHLHAAQKLPTEKTPNLMRWYGDVEKLPAWQQTQGAVEKALLPEVNATQSVTTADRAPNGSAPKDVRASFNYTKDIDGLTELYFYETEKSQGIHEPGDAPFEMTVHDGWSRAPHFSIDREGFALQDFHTTFDSWDDDAAVQRAFYPDVVALLQRSPQLAGVRRVLVFDHTIRSQTNAGKKLTQETRTSQRAPVTLVHCDYTAEGGPVRLKQLLPAEEAEQLLQRRVAFVNVWKPIRRVVQEHPLAMCDVTSSPPGDFFKLHLRYRDRDGENYVMRHSDAHMWYYFPDMTPDQCILLKTYDSEEDGRARFVGHSAFVDPNSPVDAPYRESVEIRTIAFF